MHLTNFWISFLKNSIISIIKSLNNNFNPLLQGILCEIKFFSQEIDDNESYRVENSKKKDEIRGVEIMCYKVKKATLWHPFIKKRNRE